MRRCRAKEYAVTIDPLSGPAGSYVNWWVLHISVTNLVTIGVMVLVFALALALPFPGGHEPTEDDR